MTAPDAVDRDVYAAFSGSIDQSALQRLFTGLTATTANGTRSLHLLFQSTGGMVADGVCLYNFFRSLPIELILYNTGQVASIATIAYLGAKKRKTSAYAAFMIHRTIFSPQAASAGRLQSLADAATLDDERTGAILRKHLRLPDESWERLAHYELTLSAEQAMACGLATEIAEWSPPPNTPIFNV